MEMAQVLHMNGGAGETSYANNSIIQQKLISLTKSIREEAIINLYCSTLPNSLAIADLGCSSGPNTFLVVSEVIKSVENLCRELNHQCPEYQVFMNDLPGNDFNNIFQSLGSFKEKLSNEMETRNMGPCYFNGVPGSFYGRIFPTKSLHFVHSTSSLHWLSKVPEGLSNNKGNIYIASTSPFNVIKAYYEQFQRDFSFFLKCRGEEMVEGGRMVLTFVGRMSDDPTSEECCNVPGLLAKALNDMVSKGIIKEEEMDTFNIPLYTPSPSEVILEVLKEGSFTINRLEVFKANLKAYGGGYSVVKTIRAANESLLASHFGEAIIPKVFSRYQEILADGMSKEKTDFVNISLSVTRKA